jgi:hypothetical protein
MNENKALVVIILCICIAGSFGTAVSKFGPDVTAQRIQACMTQPNMQYKFERGVHTCIPTEIDVPNNEESS